MSYRIEIYQGQKKRFGSRELAMKGEFQVRAYVTYKDREDQATVDFRIR